MGRSNLRAALCARLDEREDPLRMVRFLLPVAADRTSLIPSLSSDSQPLLSCTSKPYGGIPMLVVSDFYILVCSEMLGSLCSGNSNKGIVRTESA